MPYERAAWRVCLRTVQGHQLHFVNVLKIKWMLVMSLLAQLSESLMHSIISGQALQVLIRPSLSCTALLPYSIKTTRQPHLGLHN